MQKGQTFKTPSRMSPAKKQNLSQNLSQSKHFANTQNNSQYMSKSLCFAHSSFPVKCFNQSHYSSDIQYICLKPECDKPYRLACIQCIKGHHNCCSGDMLKISEFLNNENQKQLPFEVNNWPANDIGKDIKYYIEGEEKYIQGLYDSIENYFDNFLEKIQIEMNKMKQNMQSDVANYYKKGSGKKKIDFINQLKNQYVESYNLNDLQAALKDLINRGLQGEVFNTKIEYFINSHQNQQKRNSTNNFFLNNKITTNFTLDFQHLSELQKNVTEQIHRCRKITNNSKKFELPKTTTTDQIHWSEQIHASLNYLNKQYKNLNERDIVQYKSETYADGSKYEGFLVNGFRDIIGARYYVDGNTYVGEWAKGVKSGNGLFYYFKGNIYEGSFHDDKREGFGKELYQNGAKFEGEWSNDMKNGNGQYLYADGRIFQGTYQNDKRQGYGKIIHFNKKEETVLYRDGVRVNPNEAAGGVQQPDENNQEQQQHDQQIDPIQQQQEMYMIQ